MTVHSHVLAKVLITTAATWTTVATVPTGEVWIVKSLSITNYNVASATVYARIQDAASVVASFVSAQAIPAATTFYWQGWIVAEAGHSFLINSDVVTLHAWWSGSKLG